MKTIVLSAIFTAFAFFGASSLQAQMTMTPKGLVPNANNETVTEYDVMLKEEFEEEVLVCLNREYTEMLFLESELIAEEDSEMDATEDETLFSFASKDEEGVFEPIASVDNWDLIEEF
ncbi:MAG: hypothetical protein ACKVTZ_13755 [Bacteroidia bacterium]